MKANELMVGDLVRVNRDGLCIKKGTIVQVRGIDGDDKIEEKGLFGAAHCRPLDEDQFDGGIWLDYLDPIPLTPEILEKNGFVKCIGGRSKKSLQLIGDGLYVSWWNDRIVIRYKRVLGHPSAYLNCDCRYVHELQHALRLCGLEGYGVVCENGEGTMYIKK